MRAIMLSLALLAGCAALQKTGALAVASDAGDHAAASEPPAIATRDDSHRDMITRDESRRLIGLTVDDAKQQLAALGFHGKIQIDEAKDLADTQCQYDRVCDVFPADFGLDAPIALRVGKAKLEIAPP